MLVLVVGTAAEIQTGNGQEMVVGTDIVTVTIDIVMTAADTRLMTGTGMAVTGTVTVTAVIGIETVVNGWKMRLTGHV